MEGVVKSFSSKDDGFKGYGFIRSDAVKGDIFFHASSTSERLDCGDKVSFELVKHEKGNRARCIKKL